MTDTVQNRLKVIYVTGVGRSGSTILDILLGNHPEVESVGELINVNRSGWLKNEYCACHQRALDCPFWQAVLSNWQVRTGGAQVQEYMDLQTQFEFRLYKPSQILKEARKSPDSYARFLQLTGELFRAISEVSGKSIIVDSSKSRTRGFLLSQIDALDVRYVHLIRDTRDIIKSLRKGHEANPEAGVQHALRALPGWRTSMSWVLTNLQAEHLIRHYGSAHHCQVRYEDMLEHPAGVLRSIGELAGIDTAGIIHAAENETPLQVGHTVAGNRLRMKDTVAFSRRKPSVPKLRAIDNLSFSVFAYWLAQRYGYPLIRR
ncbi:sulfotransferase [Granulosicoccaceae sp. 1_MG-2023]|nr:sulfotransferase [Granulosicoccaceae sp. 1_MG-2023]